MSPHSRALLHTFKSPGLNIWSKSQSTLSLMQCTQEQKSMEVKPFAAMPSPIAWPLVGHLPFLLKKSTQDKMDQAFEGLRTELGDIFRLRLPGVGNMVVIFKPEDIKTMYSNEGKFPIVPAFQNVEKIQRTMMKEGYKSHGLLNNTEEWYNVRHLVQQDMMRPKSALYFISDIETIASELVDKIMKIKDEDGMLEPSEVLREFAAESIGIVFLGTRLGALHGQGDGARLIELQNQTMSLYMKLFMLPPRLLQYHPACKTFVANVEESFDICKKYVDEVVQSIGPDDDSVIARLVRKCGADSSVPLVMGADALMVGIDTTGSQGTFLLYHLAANPDKQDLLYQEICDIVGPKGHLTETSISKMKYLKACQTESQRILPAAFGSGRVTTQPMVLGGYTIPVGTLVFRNGTSSIDANNFQQPETFTPERWLRDGPERHKAHSFANIPFGHGARSCIGQRFAKLELYLMVVKVVQRFRMEYEGENVGTLTQFISVPDKPVNIRFIER